ncbi:murein biosynthesis integral membrane protein MurJ [Streptomyces rishiriensis]|uniref:Peptidoglycan lipid II flippase n=1 Tax=Streptomyces rishiriensis TaxID=68264 RepID=A0ABU0NPS9_STRRH|nr:lipid II flippase MurJ [Streptomyces rishiriensis]MDQ0581109.1 putative peptidoglycan lipid II flippase [Streptomyces rishiriensis]
MTVTPPRTPRTDGPASVPPARSAARSGETADGTDEIDGTAGADATAVIDGTAGADGVDAAAGLGAASAAGRNAEEGGGEKGGDGELPPASGRFLARATLVTAVLSVAGALLGLVRDQALARLFGAGSDTDAFLVAWTVPEFAATLLIEDGLAFALIPAFSMALARRSQGAPGDPVRALVAGTLPRLSLAFVAVGALFIGLAPQLVEILAPGLPDPALAVDCTRLTATCAVSFGLAGYCSAALRAHRRYGAPAAIYVAYNVGIITGMFVLGGRWGVRSAAAGVAVGGLLMVLVQLPSLLGQLRKRGVAEEASAQEEPRPLDTLLLTTVLLFALCRQSQVLIERFLASQLPAGAISHLNYAQKVAQMPMILSVMVCTVTFPVVARALAEGDTERARTRVERDLALAACVVLLGTAAVLACSPQIIEVLFQRGAFTAKDTAVTAGVMRVYALGLLGQTLVGVLVRSYFSAGRGSWYPVGAMASGIVVTSWIGALSVNSFGVYGIAAANAIGITVTALVLLAGMGPRSVPVGVRSVLRELSRPVRAALVATLAGSFAAGRFADPLAGLAAGGFTVTVVFLLLGRALGSQGIVSALRPVRSATRRFSHVRS